MVVTVNPLTKLAQALRTACELRSLTITLKEVDDDGTLNLQSIALNTDGRKWSCLDLIIRRIIRETDALRKRMQPDEDGRYIGHTFYLDDIYRDLFAINALNTVDVIDIDDTAADDARFEKCLEHAATAIRHYDAALKSYNDAVTKRQRERDAAAGDATTTTSNDDG